MPQEREGIGIGSTPDLVMCRIDGSGDRWGIQGSFLDGQRDSAMKFSFRRCFWVSWNGRKDQKPNRIVLSCRITCWMTVRGISYPSSAQQCASGCSLKTGQSLCYFQSWVQVSEPELFIFKNKKLENKEEGDLNMLVKDISESSKHHVKSYFYGNGVTNPNALLRLKSNYCLEGLIILCLF